MSSRYPLIRLELFQTHQQAKDSFKEARTVFKDKFKYQISDLTMEDRYLKVIFKVCDVSLLRGIMADKIVINFPICVTDELFKQIRGLINPKTTVENPLVLKGTLK